MPGRIYTRTGDNGETGTAEGSRLTKHDPLIHAQGDLDELNCMLGLLTTRIGVDHHQMILDIQHALFDIGAEISTGEDRTSQVMIDVLERRIDACNAELEPLSAFILPGGNVQGATCHLARAMCRRAERSLVALQDRRRLNALSLAYINRLSDLLFVLARVLNGGDEIQWDPNRKISEL